jgi:IQ motif and SEC7 domain-containing protein
LPVDEALRKFQTHFRMPGEAQKIEHLTHAFSLRYIECNKFDCKKIFKSAEDTVDVLSYAIILLNTSLYNPNVKQNEKMKFDQFVKMTKGIDSGNDIDKDYMHNIYERIKTTELKPGKDHTNSVNEFEKNLVGAKKPTTLFALPFRRLVCLVQLYEVFDLTKKEKLNSHQRECFLFNDMLVVTKIFSKKKNNTLYTYRCGFPLQNMNVVLFVTNHYQYGIRLIRMPEKKVLITFNARNENDQQFFCRDLAEAIAEVTIYSFICCYLNI